MQIIGALWVVVFSVLAALLAYDMAGLRQTGKHLPWLSCDRWFALLMLPTAAAIATAGDTSHQVLDAALLLLAVAGIVVVPRLAALAVPYALLGLGAYGLELARGYGLGGNASVLYGAVLAGAGSWRTHLVLLQAGVFAVAGLWLMTLTGCPGAGLVLELTRELLGRGRRPPALLLIPPAVLAAEMAGDRLWLSRPDAGFWLPARILLPGLLIAAAVALVIRLLPRLAAVLGVAGLAALGVYGMLMAEFWPLPGSEFGVVAVASPGAGQWAAAEGFALLALAVLLAPRAVVPGPDPEVTRRLTQRVHTLTRTRSDAAGIAVAELRRIERDLHDGAQARLVALGMSLRAAERVMDSSPGAARALVAEAREASSRALTDLRDLVRGIYPPVLADRGLGDAVRALALDCPLRTEVTVELPAEVEMPVAAAVYFAVAEVLTNAVRHSGASLVRITLRHSGQALRAEITDDGSGGADSSRGTGLAGVEGRLATFDGILAVSSPLGGPTIVVIEVPCALSLPKTSTC